MFNPRVELLMNLSLIIHNRINLCNSFHNVQLLPFIHINYFTLYIKYVYLTKDITL